MNHRRPIALGLLALVLALSTTACRGPRAREAVRDDEGRSPAVQVGGHMLIRATD